MTIIAAICDGQHAVIASDSDGATEFYSEDHGSKVFEVAPGLVAGAAGSCIVGAWCRRHLRGLLADESGVVPLDPEHLRSRLEDAWDAYRRHLHERSQRSPIIDLKCDSLVLATAVAIYIAQADGSVVLTQHYAARGSGVELAMGSLYTTLVALGWDDIEGAARVAVETCLRHSPSCGGSVHVARVGPPLPSPDVVSDPPGKPIMYIDDSAGWTVVHTTGDEPPSSWKDSE